MSNIDNVNAALDNLGQSLTTQLTAIALEIQQLVDAGGASSGQLQAIVDRINGLKTKVDQSITDLGADDPVTPPALTITGFSPASGAPGDVITINGTGFDGATTFQFAGSDPEPLNVTSETEGTAVVPLAAQTGAIVLEKGGSFATSVDTFTVNA